MPHNTKHHWKQRNWRFWRYCRIPHNAKKIPQIRVQIRVPIFSGCRSCTLLEWIKFCHCTGFQFVHNFDIRFHCRKIWMSRPFHYHFTWMRLILSFGWNWRIGYCAPFRSLRLTPFRCARRGALTRNCSTQKVDKLTSLPQKFLQMLKQASPFSKGRGCNFI